MVYILLNILAMLVLAFFTHILDKNVKSNNPSVSTFSIAGLIATIESILLVSVLIMKFVHFDVLIPALMKLIAAIDGIMFVFMSSALIGFASPKKKTIVTIVKYLLIFLAIYMAFFKYNTIYISLENGIFYTSDYLFTGTANILFPWTWRTVYIVLYKYLLPVVSYIFLVLLQENKNATQLEKYQTVVMGEGLIIMGLINLGLQFVHDALLTSSLFYIYAYLFMYFVFYRALTQVAVPSGKAILVTFFKTIMSYLLPAAFVGFLSGILQPQNNFMTFKFVGLFCVYSTAVIIFALWISEFLNTSSKLYTADYEAALEKALATIDYADGEMDQITEQMFDILRRNVESSSMSVYILTSQNELEVAYSSNDVNVKIPLSNPIFDKILNINKNIVIQSQIEKEHDLSLIQKELNDFFKLTKSDAFFILNEGHNIFGLITLGIKTSGDHYKEYDYNVFEKLYSYFFVFCYYMRNISNKDIIGIVNREIRMSSQIITSIQENIDHVKNPKIDVGYLMVPAHNIGGEFIDLIRLTDKRHLFVVGDLSGKGIAASMNMVILKSIIRTYLAEVHDFKQLVKKLNTFVRDSLPKGTIFAGLFAMIDFETDTMYYINCGIPTLMMYTQIYNNVIEIQGSGHILGFVKDISPFLSVKTTKLSSGDIFLACTDGLIQAHSLRGEQFGKERVQQALIDNTTYPAQRMAQFVFDGLIKFMSKEMEDDVSILTLKYEGGEKRAEQPEKDSAANTDEEKHVEISDEEKAVEELEVSEDAKGLDTEKQSTEIEIIEESSQQETSESENAATSPIGAVAASGSSEGFEMPDLSDIDALMKEAGL